MRVREKVIARSNREPVRLPLHWAVTTFPVEVVVVGNDRDAHVLGNEYDGQGQSYVARVRVDVDRIQQTNVVILDQS